MEPISAIEQIEQFLGRIAGTLWGPYALAPVLVIFALGFTIATKFIQIRRFGHGVNLVTGRFDDPHDEGSLSHFKALSTALSATIGLGNIAGVAIAIRTGGPGAVFWMWVTGLFGMATKYCTCLLAMKYRRVELDGNIRGGPMYYIEDGLGKKWKPLGIFFAVAVIFSSFGMANLFQTNQVACEFHRTLGIQPWVTGLLIATLVFLVIIGGIRRIGEVAGRIVPLMCVLYVLGAIGVMLLNAKAVPVALALIVKSAFTGTAVVGGFKGAAVWFALSWGIRRGIFSNEAGLGSAPIAHSAAKTKEPVREGLVAMLGPFIDTIVVCTMTATVIIVTGMWKTEGLDAAGNPLTGAALAQQAFTVGLHKYGGYIVTIAVFFFAYSTCLAWSYYGEKAAEYIGGRVLVMPYKLFFVVLCFIGAYMADFKGAAWFDAIINFSDISNALMAVPNLLATLLLLPVVLSLTRDYFDRRERGLLP